MSKLSDIKLQQLKGDYKNSLWYITKQDCNFRNLAMMASILELWNDDEHESFQNFFDRIKISEPYNSYIEKSPHRALKNCEFYGLMSPDDSSHRASYSSSNLTDSYFEIKGICKGNFQDKESKEYQNKIEELLENMNIMVENNTISPIMYTLKVLLLIGDITGKYSINNNEFKLFVCTCKSWNEYFTSVESILRFREDSDFHEQALRNYKIANDTRFNLVFGNNNISYIDSTNNAIQIVEGKVKDVMRKVAEYELNDSVEKNQSIIENQQDIHKYSPNSNSRYISYLTAIKSKPFLLLAGISGTGKSRIVRKLAQATVTKELQGDDYAKMTPEVFETKRWDIHKPANFELIQVKPNWHNSMDVVGYLSNIPEPHYVFTPFIQFIVEAWKHTDIPYFLCLDEMNLAPVEEYFAEFLSAIESRGFEKGEYITDPIIKPFKDFGEVKIKIDDYNNAPLTRTVKVHQEMINFLLSNSDADYAKLEKQFKERGLTLPPNLIVIGTVNMDETTFSFSRKVLDRAMSIEMNEVYYDQFLNDTTDDELKAIVAAFNDGTFKDETGAKISINKYLTERLVQAKDIIHNIDKEDSEFVINYLTDINELLDGTPFKLGYRAANEALIYLYSSKLLGCADNSEAMDKFTLMKILSRIEGDESRLRLTSVDIERLKNIGITFEDKDPNILSALRDIINKHLGSVHETTEEKTDNEDTDSENKETSETNDTETESVEEETDEESVETETTKTNNRKELKKWDSVKKAESMINALERDHFVSYWN